jgi:hypothetical protein
LHTFLENYHDIFFQFSLVVRFLQVLYQFRRNTRIVDLPAQHAVEKLLDTDTAVLQGFSQWIEIHAE